ncbi:MAG: ABC transporter permease [Candidatus Moraniibacteriota bacterium]
MLGDLLQEIFSSLSSNKARSGLTILGIVIGIASVITMVAIGQGAQSSIESSIEAIGSNLIIVTPGGSRSGAGGVNFGRGNAQTLTLEDVTALQDQLQNVSGVAPEVSRRYQITAGGNNTNTSVLGTTPAYLSIRNIAVDYGSFFTDQQIKTISRVAVLGPTTRDDLFGAGVDPTGQIIRINNVNFQIIGVTMSKGGSGFANPDDMVYVPVSTAQQYLAGSMYVTTIDISAQTQDAMKAVQQEATDILLARHKISDPTQADFSILNQTDIIATASSITGTFTILLASIAGISLLVGGIGIMNMMLTTVTERTREIGLRKAVGVRKIYINLQFLGEAVALTFFGGLLGVLLGWGASLTVTHFVSTLTTQITMSSVLLAFGVSAGVGIVFGFYPARRAANLSPIDALRYE